MTAIDITTCIRERAQKSVCPDYTEPPTRSLSNSEDSLLEGFSTTCDPTNSPLEVFPVRHVLLNDCLMSAMLVRWCDKPNLLVTSSASEHG